jgi:hypothetical protein
MIGHATRSRGATANVLGRNHNRHVPVEAAFSAPQFPQKPPAGTVARQPGHSQANSSLECTDIAVKVTHPRIGCRLVWLGSAGAAVHEAVD